MEAKRLKVKEEEHEAERAAAQAAEQQFRAERAEQVLLESERKKKAGQCAQEVGLGTHDGAEC